MVMCVHEDSREKDWLPTHNNLLGLHTHCNSCGVVKNVSTDKGKKIGYFSNSIHRLRKHMDREGYKISKSQIRLILSEFESEGWADPYNVSFSNQRKRFTEIVKKHVRISERVIMQFV